MPAPAAARVRLFVAVRPFLVNPPTQFLNAPHGVARIDALSFSSRQAIVNGTTHDLGMPDSIRLRRRRVRRRADDGISSERGIAERHAEIRDETGLASGAFAWDLEIPSGGAQAVVLDVPLYAGVSAPSDPF